MTVEEALVIAETALDYKRLNEVQKLVFLQSWEGRSYAEIAKSTRYEPDYIKDVGAKLWRLLSKALGEKVKKDNLQVVLKRYLRRTQVNVQRNLTIEVNLSGANLSGANLSGTRLVANLIETDFCQADSQKVIMPENNTESTEATIQDEEEILSNSEEQIYYWNGLRFHTEEEVQIAEALDRVGVLFFPNSKVRLTTPEGRQNQEPNFLIFHEGKWGILDVWHQDAAKNEEFDNLFRAYGIHIIEHYDANRCREQPDSVVQDFLDILSQA
jgi:hypothetical protein